MIYQHFLSGRTRCDPLHGCYSTLDFLVRGCWIPVDKAHCSLRICNPRCLALWWYVICTLWLIPLVSAELEWKVPVNSTLLFVFTLSRHGDRSPIHKLTHDPYKDHWSDGYGQLTAWGVRQHVELGQFIRHQYASLLPRTYRRDFYFFRSSGTARTIQSATSFISGLFNTAGVRKSNPSMIAAAPPVYSMPTKDDRLLKTSSFCPRAKHLVDTLFNGPEAMDKTREYERTIRVLQVLYPHVFPSGKPPSNLLLGSWKICDPLTIWMYHNLPNRPPWLTPQLQQDCEHLLDWKQYIRFSETSLTRLHGGPLVAHLLRLLRSRADAERIETGRKPFGSQLAAPHGTEMLTNVSATHCLVSYFAHDSTLAAVLSHLGVFDRRKPPLASSLIVELHEIHKNRGRSDYPPDWDPFYVRLLYRNYAWPMENSQSPVVLWPAACDPRPTEPDYQFSRRNSLCSLTRLESSVRGTYALAESEECDLPSGWFQSLDRVIAANRLLIHSVAVLVTQLMLFVFVQRNRTAQTNPVHPSDTD